MENYSNNTSSNSEMPLFVVYLKFLFAFLLLLAVGIPCGLVIRVMVKETELHTKYYFFLVVLLACDILYVFGKISLSIIALCMS